MDLNLALLKGTSHAKWLKLSIATKAQRCVCLPVRNGSYQLSLTQSWIHDGTRCVCVSVFSFERRSAVAGDLIPHAVGRKWRVFLCVCVSCYRLGQSLFCHVIGTPPPQHWWAYEIWWDKMQRKIILTCLCVFALQWKQITCSLADTSGLFMIFSKTPGLKKTL